MYKLKPAFKAEWIRRLRSGDYKQGTGKLCRIGKIVDGVKQPDEFCCWGVAAQIGVEQGGFKIETHPALESVSFIKDEAGSNSYPTRRMLQWMVEGSPTSLSHGDLRVGTQNGTQDLASLNDSGADFNTIAFLIERDL